MQDISKEKISDLPFITDFKKNKDWRKEKPVVDRDKCIKCGVCYLFCPDSAIRTVEEGYFEADEALCKGCGVCKAQCVSGCISMEKEELPARHPRY